MSKLDRLHELGLIGCLNDSDITSTDYKKIHMKKTKK